MQRTLKALRRSDDEAIKEAGLLVDFDEIARKGKISAEESLVAKWYGVYSARQPGNFMLRVVLPGGVMTSAQARTLAQVAESYAQGRIAFTTRQCAQLHWVKLFMLPLVLRDLAQAGLSTFHGCGDVTRNVAACPWASVCPHRRFDVLPYAKRTATLLTASRDLDNLPRKFKISFSGCGAGCAQPRINCVGLTAVQRAGGNGRSELGFAVAIGGGIGWKPMLARDLFGFVPAEQAAGLCRAIGLFFAESGDRYDRSISRLKFAVQRLGITRCRQRILELFEGDGGDPALLEVEPVTDSGPPCPPRPLSCRDPVGTNGLVIQRVGIAQGELRFHQLKRLAELSEMYGDKILRATNRQNLEIHGVRPQHKETLSAEIAGLGLAISDFHGLLDVVTCVGTKYCPLAVSRTHDVVGLLRPLIERDAYRDIRDRALINVCGCPNGCAPYPIADIGLRGMRIREQLGSVEGYQISLGGSTTRLGQVLGEYKNEDCVCVVERVLDTFCRLGEKEETLAEHVQRAGMGPYRRAVDDLGIGYEQAPAPREFNIVTGTDASPLAGRTLAKDIPCQRACPAGTDVPGYIEQVARGHYDQAYRINQEHNVFPGVLGRVCTRPCEPACRHRWTGTFGPVNICHLKRAAADHRSEPARPLPPWFGPTGKRVAVIGAGPAGLTAARELKRFGHEVSVFERDRVLGGMMRHGIPTFRLPREVVEEEVNAIVDSGIDTRPGELVDRERLEQLVDGYDTVLVAAGTIRPQMLELDGLPETAALGGLDFVKRYNRGDAQKLHGDVVIIGGGFTAIDCARVAQRLVRGQARVSIVYRRTEGQMSANPDELWQVRLEGITIETLAAPVSVQLGADGIEQVTFQRTRLVDDAPRTGDKPAIEPVPDSEFAIPCKTLIFAIGQSRAVDLLPEGVTLTGGHGTSHPHIFVAGDFASGSLDVVHAVGSGKSAADAIDAYLMGRRRRESLVVVEPGGESGRLRDHDLATPRAMPMLPLADRRGDAEVETGFDVEAARINAWRCYLCNDKYEIDQDRCIHCDWCIKVSPRDCIRSLTRFFSDKDGALSGHVETTVPQEATFIWIDSDQCIRCGNCLRICPTEAISLRRARRLDHSSG